MPDGPMPEEPTPDDAAVRALLASLREPDPAVPPDVAARLDARLAALTAAPPEQPGHAEGTVVDLPAPPVSRRTARSVLVAAAVAAVVGLGAVQVLDPLGGRTESVESAAGEAADAEVPTAGGDGAESAGSSDRGAAPESAPQALEDRDPTEDPEAQDAAPARGRLPALSTRSFALDVAALPSRESATPQPRAACTPGGLPPGTEVRAVLLDSRPGVLALLPPGTEGAGEDSRVAEAWQCRDLAGPAGTAAPPRARVVVAAG